MAILREGMLASLAGAIYERTKGRHMKKQTVRLGAVLGLAAMALVNAMPAAAASFGTTADCNAAGGSIQVAITPGGALIIEAPDPTSTFIGHRTVRVYCQDASSTADLGDITDAKITVKAIDDAGGPAAVFDISFDDVPTLTIAGSTWLPSPATSPVFSGSLTFYVKSETDNLATTTTLVDVGDHTELVVGADSGAFQGGNIMARTPELGSIALFGSGALSMAGYALARARAARPFRRDD